MGLWQGPIFVGVVHDRLCQHLDVLHLLRTHVHLRARRSKDIRIHQLFSTQAQASSMYEHSNNHIVILII